MYKQYTLRTGFFSSESQQKTTVKTIIEIKDYFYALIFIVLVVAGCSQW